MKGSIECEYLPQETIKYPCLMQHVTSQYIVLMNGPEQGTVVCVWENSPYDLGSFRPDWKMQVFRPFYGTIVLKSK